jgi:hypothetical protein
MSAYSYFSNIFTDFSEIFVKIGSEFLTAASVKMAVSWVVAPCSLVDVYRRFRGICCRRHQSYEATYHPDDGGSSIRSQSTC